MTTARGLLLLAVLALGAPAARAAEPPQEVAIGFYVLEVRELDLKAQSFYTDFYMWIRYRTADKARAQEIERIEFMNGRVDGREENDRKAMADQVYVCWRISGTFFFRTQLRNYPFDTQTLPIIAEHSALDTSALVFVEDSASYARSAAEEGRAGVQEGLALGEFRLIGTSRAVLPWVYKTDFGDPTRPDARATYSRAMFTMRFGRDFWPYLIKIVMPLVVIVGMAYLVFWLPPREIQTASGLAITALLSCIAFNVAVAQSLPEVGYLIVSDKFFITTYMILFMTLIQSVVTYVWNESGRDELARKWDVGCRIVFPILYFAAFGYLVIQGIAGRSA